MGSQTRIRSRSKGVLASVTQVGKGEGLTHTDLVLGATVNLSLVATENCTVRGLR